MSHAIFVQTIVEPRGLHSVVAFAVVVGGGGTYALSLSRPLSASGPRSSVVGARSAAPDPARPTSNWADERTDGRLGRTDQRTDALSVCLTLL